MKLSSRLPDGPANGLDAVEGRMIREPDEATLVVGMLDVHKTIVNHDTGDEEPVVRLRYIEAVPAEHAGAARTLLETIKATRTGEPLLPVDPETGEVVSEEGTDDD